jgi:serine/threonine protein kinase
MDLPAGTILGDSYRITRLIGVGGMGAIYEAAQVGDGKRVAIKMMSKELAAHPEALARFRREVKVTTELAHPNIIEVVDVGSSPTGEPYLVMEYLDGEDLEARL